MPWNAVPEKFSAGTLHSGGPNGPLVTNRKQMVAILMSEKRQAAGGKTDYQPSLHGLKQAARGRR